ncbi:hypothetical protein Btru_025275 [Bulinus truncatus]|nr:hypothetical protein Btru_025275 [Bulinus truncatus]
MFLGLRRSKEHYYKIKFVRRHELAGFMLWTLDFDDFSGTMCSDEKYPILKAAVMGCMMPVSANDKGNGPDMLKPTEKPVKQNEPSPPKTPSPSVPNTTGAPASPAMDPKSLCGDFEGVRDYPGQCNKYLHCTSYNAFVASCPGGLLFNKKVLACDWKANVPEC